MLEYAGPVLDQLYAAVEGSVLDHFEGDVRVAVVDALCARGPGPPMAGTLVSRRLVSDSADLPPVADL